MSNTKGMNTKHCHTLSLLEPENWPNMIKDGPMGESVVLFEIKNT